MDIKYATGLTTIENATYGTLYRIESMINSIIDATTAGLQIEDLYSV